MVLKATLSVAVISGILATLLVIAEYYLANYGECKLDINDGDKVLTVEGGASLLASLGRQKIFLPSACGGRGTCGYCKCKVLDGVGPLLPTEEPLLDQEEIDNNMRMACQVKVKQDMKIAVPEELFNIKQYDAQVSLIQDLTYDIKFVRIQLTDPDEINFRAGQYAQLSSKPYENVGDSVSRAYSIASPPSQKGHIDFMIRLVPEGICSTWVHHHLQEGENVKLIAPVGDFFIREGEKEIIMVAGGSGMAPLAAMLYDIAENPIDRAITFFFGAVTMRDIFYLEEMQELEKRIPNFRFVPTLSKTLPEDNWNGETGLITAPLENYLRGKDNDGVQAYMCGSPGMVNACTGVLTQNGIKRSDVFFDPFA